MILPLLQKKKNHSVMNKQAFQNNYFLLAKGHSWVKLHGVKDLYCNYMSFNEFIELYFFSIWLCHFTYSSGIHPPKPLDPTLNNLHINVSLPKPN